MSFDEEPDSPLEECYQQCEKAIERAEKAEAELATLKIADARRTVALEAAWLKLVECDLGHLVPDEYEEHGHNAHLADARELLASIKEEETT